MDVAVLGSGAMGALFGGHLAATGVPVTLVDVWEEHVRALEEEGLRMETPEGETKTIPVEATTDPGEVDADLVLVFVKSTHTADAVEDAASLLADADVLTLQNGLGNPETIAETVDRDRIIAGVTAHGSTLVGPGQIRHAGRGPTTIGRYFTDNDGRVEEVAARFTEAGIETDVSETIEGDVWEKVVVNVGINAITALARVRNGKLVTEPPGERLLRAAVEEATHVAAAEGYDLADDVDEYVLEVAEKTGANRSSMRQDVEAGRQTEIETLNGEVVRRGREAGVATPVNRTLSDLVRLAERAEPDSGS